MSIILFKPECITWQGHEQNIQPNQPKYFELSTERVEIRRPSPRKGAENRGQLQCHLMVRSQKYWRQRISVWSCLITLTFDRHLSQMSKWYKHVNTWYCRIETLANLAIKCLVTEMAPLHLNLIVLSYQWRKSHCGDTMISWPTYLYNGISYTSKTTSFK